MQRCSKTEHTCSYRVQVSHWVIDESLESTVQIDFMDLMIAVRGLSPLLTAWFDVLHEHAFVCFHALASIHISRQSAINISHLYTRWTAGPSTTDPHGERFCHFAFD